MASETGGIALLSMYNDEEEELTEAPPSAAAEVASEPVYEAADDVNRYEDAEGRDKDTTPEPAFESTTTPPFGSRSTPHSDEGVDYDEALKSSTPLPLPPVRSSYPFTLFLPTMRHPSSDPLDPPGTRRPAFSIVDYGHDDTAMSPELKEEAILVNDGVTVSAEVQVFEVKLDERTPPGTVQILTSDAQQEPLKSSELSEVPKSDTSSPMNFTGNEAQVSQVDETIVVSVEIHKADPLISFLHLPLLAKCSDGLQEKINKFIAYKRAGKSFNADLRNRKDYRNPDFLQHAVRYQEIDEIGSCFSKDVFDPHGYDKSDYYDEIENEMRREIERKDLKRKKSREMEFVSGGTSVIPTSKFRQNPVASMSIAVNTALSTTSTAGDAVGKDTRQNKKTKWDKNAVSGGQNNVPTIGLHSSILSAANAGSGYTVFAEQKPKKNGQVIEGLKSNNEVLSSIW